MGILDRLSHAWNAFVGVDPPSNRPPRIDYTMLGPSSSYRPDRVYFRRTTEKSLVSSYLNRIANDCASIAIKHVKLDSSKRYTEDVKSGLNECLTIEANIDQTSKMFIRDVVMSMFDEGVVAICPIDTTFDPSKTNSYDINSLRVGKITQWYPRHVRVEVYNDKTGNKSELIFPKKDVAIIENPLYAIMNEPNSTLQRLIRKLAILDVVDEQSGSGKLGLIIQLPYIIKTDARRQQAETRRQDIEQQLANSKYGIAYTDGTEKITQLNQPIENNLLKQVEYLTSMLEGQLGLDKTIMNGTADEKTMLNYLNNCIKPVMDALVDEMKRKFLTKTARSQGQSIMYFNDPFKLVPISQIAEIADKFTRNEIMSSNEMRQVVGLKPVKDEKADELRNKNINIQEEQTFASTNEGGEVSINEEYQEDEEKTFGSTKISDLMSD